MVAAGLGVDRCVPKIAQLMNSCQYRSIMEPN